jgi:hypothetical protein
MKLEPDQLASIEPGQVVEVDLTEAEYINDRAALTRSSLGLLSDDPVAFHEWMAGAEYEDDSTKETRRGSNSHLAVYQPQEWLRRVGIPEVARPPGARKTGADEARALWSAWQTLVGIRERLVATIHDRIDVTPQQYEEVRAISCSAWAHPIASVLLASPGEVEKTLLWREPETNVVVKVRLDKFSTLSVADVYGTNMAAGPTISDLKTTRDHRPEPFWRSVQKYGYLAQAALYSDVVEAWTGIRPSFYFIAVRSAAPRTSMYQPTDEQLQLGRDRYFGQLQELVHRQQSGEWRAQHELDIVALWQPPYRR